MTTDPDYVDHDPEYRRHPTAMSSDYNKGDPASNPNLKHVSSDHANQMRGQIIEEEEDEPYAGEGYGQEHYHGAGVELGPHWEAEVAAEKAHRGITPGYNHPAEGQGYYAASTQVGTRGMYPESSVDLNAECDEYHSQYQQDEEFGYDDNNKDAGACTPTQARNPPETAQVFPMSNFEEVLAVPRRNEIKPYAGSIFLSANTGIAKAEAAKADVANTANQIHENTVDNSMPPPAKPINISEKVEKGKQPPRKTEYSIPMRSATPPNNLAESKATSFGSSSPSQTSEDELILTNLDDPAAHNRVFEVSLDYTREELAAKHYDELDAEPFLTDPNEAARDQPSVEPTLEQKLSKMTDMSEEECKVMFAAMTDAENEGTGKWFVAKMREDVEKLVRAKHNRRMIAAKYEHEVKKRNAKVSAKTKDIEEELAGLKKGLGNLMPKEEEKDKKARREEQKAEKKKAKQAAKAAK